MIKPLQIDFNLRNYGGALHEIAKAVERCDSFEDLTHKIGSLRVIESQLVQTVVYWISETAKARAGGESEKKA